MEASKEFALTNRAFNRDKKRYSYLVAFGKFWAEFNCIKHIRHMKMFSRVSSRPKLDCMFLWETFWQHSAFSDTQWKNPWESRGVASQILLPFKSYSECRVGDNWRQKSDIVFDSSRPLCWQLQKAQQWGLPCI